MRAVVLISGAGSNLQAMIDAVGRGALDVELAAVLSNRARAPGLERARRAGIANATVVPQPGVPRGDYDRELGAAIESYRPALVILAGFMRILGNGLVERYAGRMLNVHPSLLPAYRGLDTHRRALEAGERVHGCTVHFVTAELDGGPAIVQARVPVLPGDDPASLSARVQAAEHRIYPLAVQWFATGRLCWRGGAPWLDGARLETPVIVDTECAQ